MSTGTQVCDITLPGYTLTERIGSGGYAEVWRAEAPGGIEKAVKIVYGCYEDEFATQELKALERIKGVRHPFLLSLERFEIINGRLAILTELADMSLDQRLMQCRTEGLLGIPRDELLRYMADAAEALDYLSQRHHLLHLDIKPENLLISGDHIKVADFGLVKELATRTNNSLVSGMTPTYAAPEMFDDEPSAFSDQYSLAIVYQQMLVGSVPFPGRTAAQLAKQHTQAEPQLMSLPAEDRTVIARALSKKPSDRFPSCRSFVDALARRADSFSPAPTETPRPAPAAPPPSPPAPDDDTKPPSFCTTIRRSPAPPPETRVNVTQPVRRDAMPVDAPAAELAALERLVPEETVDIAVPEANVQLQLEQPTLFIAIGGVGINVLCRTRARLAPQLKLGDAGPAIESIALDTDRDELREACSARWKAPLAPEDTQHLPLRLPKSYDNSREILGWLSRRWLYNIPRSLETRGYRPLGRIALVDHSQRVLALIETKLKKLAALAGSPNAAGEFRDTTIRVVLVNGTGGGTGAGMVIDVANAVRSLATARKLPVDVHGFLVCTCFANNNSSPLVAANTYSLLTELNHVTTLGNETSGEKTAGNEAFDSAAAPFDHVYCVPARTRTKGEPTVDPLETLASYLSIERLPAARASLRTCRNIPTPREETRGRSLVLRKVGFGSLAAQRTALIDGLAHELCETIKRYWLTPDDSHDWERLIREERQAAIVPSVAAPESDHAAAQTVAPVNETTPLSIRSRFKQFINLEFASEITRQIQHQLESRDDRGRPLIGARDAKSIADTAREVVASLAGDVQLTAERSRFDESPTLRALVGEGSRRVLSRAVAKFDFRTTDRFLPPDAIDEIVQAECHALLEERLGQLEFAAAISGLMNIGMASSAALENATADLLQCGCERRTLLLAPRNEPAGPAIQMLQTTRPLAAIVPTDVDDVVIISEEAGISPRSFGMALERVFPGIADAARRLFTRIDIDWRPLV